MKEKLKLFEDAIFLWNGREYKVMNAKILDHKASIITNRQTFVKYESELDSFINEITFIDKSNTLDSSEVVVKKEEDRKKLVEETKKEGVVIYQSVHHAEIIGANERALRISEKLESVFDEISAGCADDKLLKKADAMLKVSNAIVNNEMMRFKYLNLK